VANQPPLAIDDKGLGHAGDAVGSGGAVGGSAALG
jgi:hypothetical protein